MALHNTTVRVIVAIFGIPFLIAVTYFGGIPFLALGFIIGLASYYEFHIMTKNKKTNTNLFIGMAAVFVIILNAYFSFTGYLFILLITIALLTLTEMFRNNGSAIHNIGSSLLGIVYIGLSTAALIFLRQFYGQSEMLYTQGGFLILAMFASIWICDSAAFFIGTAFGKHKLFPRISPNKSWEGAVAGFVFSIITMIAARALIVDFLSMTDTIIIGIIVGIFGQMGDLVESMIKRDAAVKDSSSILPGHGGIFDRFDSIMLSSIMVYLYLFYFG